jgi:hypothetical protein
MNRTPLTCHELGVCNRRKVLGCTCHQHDTETLPGGSFYFAPGAIENPARRTRRNTGWRRAVLDVMALLAVAGLLGFVAGYLQAKGWPL